MPYLDTIKLGFGNNLIIGNCPNSLPMTKMQEKIAQEEGIDIESFGLFDSNTANYNTYYPEVTAEDLKPKDSEFIEPVFRALSEVIVHKEWNPVDFGENNVLKNSMSLLKGQTVNADHEMAIGNAMGAVAAVSWQDAYKTKNGIFIPAGINAKLKLDGKSHPRIARAIMMDPPAIHSTSVTVQFLWEKSHASLTEEEFFSKLGTFDKDGKMIRRIATDVKRYHEISLVSHGADPFAQIIKENGEINNAKWADVSYNSATPQMRKESKVFFFDFKTDVIKNSEVTIPAETNNNKTSSQTDTVMNKQFLLALAAVLGLEVDQENPDQEVIQNAVATAVNTRNELNTQLSEKETEITRLKAFEAKAADIAKVESLQQQVAQFTDAFRTEVLKNYNVVSNGAPVADITELINKADYATLKALNTQYTVQLESSFPLTCKDCGSGNVNRCSAHQTEDETDKDKGNKTSFSMNPAEMAQKIAKKSLSSQLSQMHGQQQ